MWQQDDLLYRFLLRVFAIVADLTQPRWGAIQLSANGVWRVLRRHGLSTRPGATAWSAGVLPHPSRSGPSRRRSGTCRSTIPASSSSSIASASGGCLAPSATVWQYTAIDVASAYAWATLQVTRRNPSATWTSALARRVAADLAARGWRLERVMSDNAQRVPLGHLPGHHRRPRRPPPLHPRRSTPANGCVERVQQTILDECWKPALARYLIPKQTGLRLDLGRYLRYYNTERAHTGRRTKGRTPDQVLGKAKLWHKNH